MYENMVGIVPIGSRKKLFGFPFEDVLMPVGEDYTLIENAAMCCAAAGCKTIWVVCNDSTLPMLRKRLGEYVKDPKAWNERNIKNHIARERYVPIFYVPCNPIDRNRWDSLGYGALRGSIMAHSISRSMSGWMVPTKYMIMSPFCATNPWDFISEDIRNQIRKKDEYFFFTDKAGNTIKDDIHLPCILSKKMLSKCRQQVHLDSTKMWADKEWDKRKRTKLPADQQYSARFFTFKDVFKALPDDLNRIQLKWYYQISNWDEYKKFMESDKYLKRPSSRYLPESAPLLPLTE